MIGRAKTTTGTHDDFILGRGRCIREGAQPFDGIYSRGLMGAGVQDLRASTHRHRIKLLKSLMRAMLARGEPEK